MISCNLRVLCNEEKTLPPCRVDSDDSCWKHASCSIDKQVHHGIGLLMKEQGVCNREDNASGSWGSPMGTLYQEARLEERRVA